MRTAVPALVVLCLALALGACTRESGADAVPEAGELVEPPFEVRGDAEGLLLVWFDEEGLHTASRRDAIPEAHREHVRVDDLGLAPDERLDPELVYVADLREVGDGGDYPVRRMPRHAFDARVEASTRVQVEVADAPAPPAGGDPAAGAPAAGEPAAPHAPSDPNADVVIYGASWCNACRSAAAYLRQRDVPFVERDVEREPGAREAMLRAAQAAGIRPSGIPVIDFRGTIIAGFDRRQLDAAIERTRAPI